MLCDSGDGTVGAAEAPNYSPPQEPAGIPRRIKKPEVQRPHLQRCHTSHRQ